MRERAYVDDLVLGEKYLSSNEYHWEYEYEEIWYMGTSYNKWDELVYCFADKEIELPENYDGDVGNIMFGGPVYTEYEIENGCLAMAD